MLWPRTSNKSLYCCCWISIEQRRNQNWANRQQRSADRTEFKLLCAYICKIYTYICAVEIKNHKESCSKHFLLCLERNVYCSIPSTLLPYNLLWFCFCCYCSCCGCVCTGCGQLMDGKAASDLVVQTHSASLSTQLEDMIALICICICNKNTRIHTCIPIWAVTASS